jgi:hypothetical protein
MGAIMELTIVDQVLVTPFDETRNVPMVMRAAGHSQDEISGLAGSPGPPATPNRPDSVKTGSPRRGRPGPKRSRTLF